MSSILKAGLPAARPTAPPLRYATAAAAAVSTPSSATAQTSPPSQAPPTPAAVASSSQSISLTAPSIPTSSTASTSANEQASLATSSPSLTHPSLTSPMLSSATSAAQGDETMYSAQDSPALSEAIPQSISGHPADSPLRVPARVGKQNQWSLRWTFKSDMCVQLLPAHPWFLLKHQLCVRFITEIESNFDKKD